MCPNQAHDVCVPSYYIIKKLQNRLIYITIQNINFSISFLKPVSCRYWCTKKQYTMHTKSKSSYNNKNGVVQSSMPMYHMSHIVWFYILFNFKPARCFRAAMEDVFPLSLKQISCDGTRRFLLIQLYRNGKCFCE